MTTGPGAASRDLDGSGTEVVGAGRGTARGRAGPGGSGRASIEVARLLVGVALLAVGVVYAWARWPGFLPLGSDNDEYQLVGRALAAFEPPVVAGVEGTKYPLGYPLVLAVLQWLRLPVAPAAIVLNLGAIAVATTLVAGVAGRAVPAGVTRALGGSGGSKSSGGSRGSGGWAACPGAALAAGAVVVASVAVWNDAFSIMPEMLTLAVVAGMLAVVAGGLTPRRVVVLTVLSVAAVSLKTLAILVIGGGSVAVALWAWARDRGSGWPRPWWQALVPAVVAGVAVLAGMVLLRPYPAHTTGYVATFLLRDPFDASLGTIGVRGLLARTWAGVPEALADLGRAIAFIDASSEVAAVVALVGLTLGVVGAWRLRPGGPLGPFVAGAVLAYTIGLTAWPYHSSRFGLPLVPVAALGVGWLVRAAAGLVGTAVGGRAVGGRAVGGRAVDEPARVGDGQEPDTVVRVRLVAGLALGGLVLAGLVVTSLGGAIDRGEVAAERLAVQHAALGELELWAAAELDGDDRLVSFDYREVARHLDRDVWPLAYTSDPDTLWAMVEAADADLVVKVSFHHARDRQLALLLEARPEAFEPVLEGAGLGVWRVVR